MLRRLQTIKGQLRTLAVLDVVGMARTGVGDEVEVKVCLLFCGEGVVGHCAQTGGVYPQVGLRGSWCCSGGSMGLRIQNFVRRCLSL
jgi:hypothetical protein